MEIIGYIASLLVGLSMGLIGGGGSILTVPILVYLFHIEPLTATSYSLFIVGSTSLLGAGIKVYEKNVDLRMALLFGIPDLIGVITMRTYLFPPIPGNLFHLGHHMVTKGECVLVLFSILMLLSARLILRKMDTLHDIQTHKVKSNKYFILLGFLTGLLTGMVGVGGGFIIIPILVLWGRLTMKDAVGTSLIIIAAKSLMGFFADKFNFDMQHHLIYWISGLALVGLVFGILLHNKIHARYLQKGFAWLVVGVGSYMLITTLNTILFH